uniref:DUF5983 domain-containing protein n=1 Tax=Escherichia coli TaxID=562 RepID=A0A6M9WVE0_ECOLX|nr:hypothetical protein HHJ25_12685 [Escherichia coli]
MSRKYLIRITELERLLSEQAEALRQRDLQLSLVEETEAFLRSALARAEEKIEEEEREIEYLRAQIEKLRRMLFGTAHITEKDNAWLYSLSHQTSDVGESEWIHFTGSGYLLRTDAWSYPVLRLKRLGLSKTFRRLVITLTRRYGVSLIHLDASAECLPGLPTFNW